MLGLLMTEVPGGGESEGWFSNPNPAQGVGLPSAYDNDNVYTCKGCEDVHCKTPTTTC